MRTTGKSKGGRPRRHQPRAGERVSLGLRVTPEMKRALDRAAELNGRSQSQEAELRIEQSFHNERIIDQALEAAYERPETVAVLMLLGSTIRDTGQIAGFFSRSGWLSDPFVFQQMRNAVDSVLDALQPPGDPIRPAIYSEGALAHVTGEAIARARLHALGLSKDSKDSRADWAGKVRERLGRTIVDRIIERLSGEQATAARIAETKKGVSP